MTPEELHLRMIRFESRAGSSEGRMAYDTGAMHNIGQRPEDLNPEERRVVAEANGYVKYQRTPKGWVTSFHDPE